LNVKVINGIQKDHGHDNLYLNIRACSSFRILISSSKANRSVTVLKTMATVPNHSARSGAFQGPKVSYMDHVIFLIIIHVLPAAGNTEYSLVISYIRENNRDDLRRARWVGLRAKKLSREHASTHLPAREQTRRPSATTRACLNSLTSSLCHPPAIQSRKRPNFGINHLTIHTTRIYSYPREALLQPTWVLGVTVSLCSTKRPSNSLKSATGLFQSDHDFDIVSELSHDAGLTQMEEEAQAAAKAAGKDDREVDDIYYSVYRQSCSNPELVRKHLDSGALVYLVAEREAAMLAMPSKKQELEHYFRDPCYIHVLLGACAMTLGCQIPNQYISMLKKVYTEGGLMPDALKQMKKALKGPHGYQNGEPYDFESKDLVETANAMDDTDKMSNGLGFIGMNVLSPGGLFDSRTFKTPG
jgi:hypothetical protein